MMLLCYRDLPVFMPQDKVQHNKKCITELSVSHTILRTTEVLKACKYKGRIIMHQRLL